MTRTLIVQSYRDHDIPPWIARCLASVRSWALQHGHDYRLVGDEAFALCGPDYLASVGADLRAITNLARLELVKAAHGEGYDLAVWVDADVLVFAPGAWSIDTVERYAFARETWIELDTSGRGRVFSAVNNSVFVCRHGEPDLDFLIAATRHVALHRQLADNYQVGGDLIKGLRSSLAFETLPTVGMFSNFTVLALARGADELVALQARRHGGPVYAANLCASGNYAPPVSEAEAAAAIEALLSTGGQAVNRWLDGSPGLAIGQEIHFDASTPAARAIAGADESPPSPPPPSPPAASLRQRIAGLVSGMFHTLRGGGDTR